MVRVAIIFSFLICQHTNSHSQDVPAQKKQYAYLSLFTSESFIGGAINYGVEKKRVGFEYGIHYPVLAFSSMQRSILGNIGLNFAAYYHNKPVEDKLHIALISRFRAIQVKTHDIVDLIDPWKPIVPPFYLFRRYWMEGYGGAMLTHYFLPRVYVRFEIYVGYMLEHKKNLDGLVTNYNSWSTSFRQHAQVGFRYELFR